MRSTMILVVGLILLVAGCVQSSQNDTPENGSFTDSSANYSSFVITAENTYLEKPVMMTIYYNDIPLMRTNSLNKNYPNKGLAGYVIFLPKGDLLLKVEAFNPNNLDEGVLETTTLGISKEDRSRVRGIFVVYDGTELTITPEYAIQDGAIRS